MATSARPIALITGRLASAPPSLVRPQTTDTISYSSCAAVNRWKRSPPNSSQRVRKSPSSPLILVDRAPLPH